MTQRKPRVATPFPEPLRHFVRLVNAGEYWESHEVLEGPWRRNRSEFYHGLILYASAFVHVRRGNAHGVVAQLGKAEQSLQAYRPAYLGVDVDRLLGHAARCRTIVVEHDAAAAEDWMERIPPPSIDLDRTRIRGDEDEIDEEVRARE